MFQFPGFAHLAVYHAFSMVGCPIRTSVDQFLFADPHSFSQLITSFFASESLGILHTLFLTSIYESITAPCSSVTSSPYFYLCARVYFCFNANRFAPPHTLYSFFSMSMNFLPGL